MASATTLPLTDIVNVTVTVAPSAVQGPAFNQALIVGTSTAIPSYGGSAPRCRQYSGGVVILQQMLHDGFILTSPEYLAASAYLSQTPTPFYLWIGRQDTTAIATFTITTPGTGYHVGDVVAASQSGTAGALLQVITIGAGGAVTTLLIIAGGTGFTAGMAAPCTGGSGTGLVITPSTVGETCVVAVQACRIVSPQWYLFTCMGATDADNIALAAWAQTAFPICQVFFQTSSTNVFNAGDVTNIFAQLTAASFNRFIGVYTTTQSLLGVPQAPNNAYFAAGLMGVVMGRNTGLANSYFILPFKNVVGMTVEPLTQTQFVTLSSQNGNAYCSYANAYTSLSPGKTGSGQYFDQILGIDMLVSDLQYDLTNILFQYPAIPQTDQGQSRLLHAANIACGKSVTRGFLGDGVWQGQNVLNLQAGMAVSGYLNQSPSYASLGVKPANRQAAPIYCAVILGEAVQSVLIAVYVQP